MTTIVFKDGIMAADTRAYSGDKKPIGDKKKIHRLKDGSLIGISSSTVGLPEKFRRSIQEHGVGHSFEEDIEVQAIVVTPKGRIYYFKDGTDFSGPITAKHICIGSGEDYAEGAIRMGADAKTAIKIAIDCDNWTGGKVQTMRLIPQ